MSQRVVLPWRGTLAVWTKRNLVKVDTRKCQVLYLEIFDGKPLHQYRLEAGKQFCREDLEIWGDNTLTMSQSCAFVVKMANSFLGCFRKKTTAGKNKLCFIFLVDLS